MPTANVVVQTIVMAHMKVAAAVKAGRKRAAIQTSRGLSVASANSKVQGLFGMKTMLAHRAAATASAEVPSASSRRGGTLRSRDAIPITSGATVMVPSASEANQ